MRYSTFCTRATEMEGAAPTVSLLHTRRKISSLVTIKRFHAVNFAPYSLSRYMYRFEMRGATMLSARARGS